MTLNEVVPKSRKLLFDDSTGIYYFETKVEALERCSRERVRQANAMNRGENVQLNTVHRQVDGSNHLFRMKASREEDALRESLREKVAHRTVLGVIAAINQYDPEHEYSLGKYGPGTSKIDIMPLIEAELKLMTPKYKRAEQTNKLLMGRRRVPVFDRKLTNSALFRQKLASRIAERPRKDRSPRRTLRLPPVEVKLAPSTAPRQQDDSETQPVTSIPKDNSLPSIFVTQRGLSDETS